MNKYFLLFLIVILAIIFFINSNSENSENFKTTTTPGTIINTAFYLDLSLFYPLNDNNQGWFNSFNKSLYNYIIYDIASDIYKKQKDKIINIKQSSFSIDIDQPYLKLNLTFIHAGTNFNSAYNQYESYYFLNDMTITVDKQVKNMIKNMLMYDSDQKIVGTSKSYLKLIVKNNLLINNIK